MDGRFFMNGDEWGLISILPAENRQQCLKSTQEYQRHHENTEFSLDGWSTPPFVIPEPEVAISTRRIQISEVETLFSDCMPRANSVDSCEDFTGMPFHCSDCFAFALSTDDYWNCEGFYGTFKDSMIETMYSTHLSAKPEHVDELSDRIASFGQKFDLILFGNSMKILDLSDRGQVYNWLNFSPGDKA